MGKRTAWAAEVYSSSVTLLQLRMHLQNIYVKKQVQGRPHEPRIRDCVRMAIIS